MAAKFKIKAIIFDFDGVLVESVDVKGDAFGELYAPYGRNIQSQVVKYHRENGGTSRFDKIRYYESVLLGRSPTEKDINTIADRFSGLVESKVIASPYVAGAQEFLELAAQKIPLFVASATPEDELKRIITARGMDHYFQGIYGSPIPKEQHLKNILNQNQWAGSEVLMIGDAISDYNAAKGNNTQFLGRHDPDTNFVFSEGTATVPDLTDISDRIEFLP